MATTFTKLFNLSLLHSYFEDGVGRNLAVVPTPATQALLRSRDYLFRETDDGAMVIARLDEKEGVTASFIPLGRNSRFSFYLISNDSRFLNYTQLEKTNGNIVYFNNLRPLGAEGKNLLCKSDKVSEADEVILRGSSFSFSPAAGILAENCSVHDAQGNVIEGNGLLKNQEGKIAVNLKDEIPGYYEVRDSSGSVQHTFYKDDFVLGKPLMGVVEIFSQVPDSFSDNRIAAYQEVNGSMAETLITEKQFIIPFAHRSTIWKYLVVEKYSKDVHRNWSIANGNSGIVFEAGGEEMLPSGEKAHVILSGSPLPLQERQQMKLQLMSTETEEADARAETKISQLPFPNVEIIKRLPGSPTYLSEIFIYV